MTIDAERLRELAAELGYWAASADEEHVARLRAQDARYDEQVAQDPGGTKWQKMMRGNLDWSGSDLCVAQACWRAGMKTVSSDVDPVLLG
jgi:hypothetical protein